MERNVRVREWCIEQAKEIALKTTDPVTAEDVIEVARKIEDYVVEGSKTFTTSNAQIYINDYGSETHYD